MIQVYSALFYLFSLEVAFRGIIHKHFDLTFRYPNEISNRMVCVLWQTWTVSLSIMNLFTEQWNHLPSYHTLYMENQMIAYFIYDLMILMSSQRGRKQIIFFIHHFISLLIAYLNRTSNNGTNFNSNSFILLLEMTTPLLNLTKIMEEMKLIVPSLTYLTRNLYAFTRIYCFSPWIVYYLFNMTNTYTNWITLMSSVSILLGSIKWYSSMK